MIAFTVPGEPVAKGRPRAVVMPGGGPPNKRIRMVTPEKTRQYEEHVRAYATLAMAEHGELTGPLAVDLTFVLKRPKRLMRKKDPIWRLPHTGRPDLDNLIKSVCDGMNGTLYEDDAQIVEISALKLYAGKGEDPHVEIRVYAR